MGGGGRPTSRWLRNKGCELCRCKAATEVIYKMRWAFGKLLLPPPAQVRDDPCAGGTCGDVDGWEARAMYYSEDCRLHHEFELFT
jgi:hypothetical protein